MKKLTIPALVALTAIVGVLLTGCGSTPSTQQRAIEQMLVTTAATAGTEQALTPPNGNPSLRPDFVAAVPLLYALSGSTNQLTVAQVQAILAAAGETNAAIKPLIPLVVNLVNVYTQGTNGIVSGNTQMLLGWIADGVSADLSLNAPPTAASAKYGRIFKPVVIKK